MTKKQYRYTKEQYQGICGLKEAILEAINVRDAPGVNAHIIELVQGAAEHMEGFLQDVATKALKYKNISEKQAYFLSAGLIEEGVADYTDFMHLAPAKNPGTSSR